MFLMCILLIAFALVYGYFTSHYLRFVLQFKSFKTPYYRLGLTFEPLTYYDDKGDTYHVSSLKIGFVLIHLVFDFYTQLPPQQPTNNDTAAYTPNTVL